MDAKRGFTLVETMVIVAICAILASVAIPAYVNYINRVRQTEAVSVLMQAKYEMEVYWAENQPNRYANNIGCLTTFGNDCSIATCQTPSGYRVFVISADAQNFQIGATKTVYGQLDRLRVASTLQRPVVETPNALKWSLFKWIFG